MTIVLLLCALTLAVTGAWLTRRRIAVVAWDRELDVAFNSGDRKEIPHHRVL